MNQIQQITHKTKELKNIYSEFLKKSAILAVFVLAIILLNTYLMFIELATVNLDVLSIFLALMVGFANSFSGIIVFDYSKKLNDFFKFVIIGQVVRLFMVLVITMFVLVLELVLAMDYVFGLLLSVPIFILIEVWCYKDSIQNIKSKGFRL